MNTGLQEARAAVAQRADSTEIAMNGKGLLSALFLLIVTLAPAAWAQTGDATEKPLDLEEIRAIRESAADDGTLNEELRTRILELYDSAVGSLEAAAASQVQTRNLERERAGIDRAVEVLRGQLEQTELVPQLPLAEGATVEQAESELARDRAKLAAERTALTNLERLSEEQTASRADISRRLGTLDQKLQAIDDELLAVTQSELHAELKRATKTNLRAQRERALAGADALRAQLALLDARSLVLPWQIDLAQRHVDHTAQMVAMLERAANDLRRAAAAQQLSAVRELSQVASERAPTLVDVAAETLELAEELWGAEGVEARSEQTAHAIAATRKHQADLNRITQLTRRKFEAFGHRGSITRWWPEVPDDFPQPGDVDTYVRELQRRIPEVQHDQIRLEQQRSEARELTSEIMETLRSEAGGSTDPELRAVARKLLDQRRELLDELIQAYGRHSTQLVELEAKARYFLGEVRLVEDFLYERILWVRSVPRPIIPRVETVSAAAGWMTAGSHLSELLSAIWRSFAGRPGRSLGVMLLFGLLLGFRRAIRRRMLTLAERVKSPQTDFYRYTLGALLYLVLLASPVPLALYVIGVALREVEGSTFLFAAAAALPFVASIAALLESTRQFLAPAGLAEGHFGWPHEVTRLIHRGLLWREIVFLPLIYVAVHLGMAGMKLSSPEQLQAHNNSLGRVCFIAALVILGFSLLSLFRPRRRGQRRQLDENVAWLHRLYMYAYPVVVLSTIVPAALAVLGYYMTGFLLAYQMLRTAWVVVAVLLLGGLLVRWREVRHRAAADEAEQEGDASLPESERQVRRLFRFVVVLVAAIGFYSVWAEAVPALQILDRIQIWPRIELIESTDDGSMPAATRVAAPEERQTESESGEPSTTPRIPTPMDPGAGQTGATPSDGSPLTLWHLIEAILAILITVVLVKNIPGLLELILKRRTRLDSGARIALGTLIRYAIIIVGVTAAFTLLGISWSKIQWLAAALTFGLGFGLQEIVANFVSGLILLMERPVRVGDAVTVGNLQGRVSRIQIRATTITLWDRSEMVVPNKEFITTKLINWTLTDSRRRIDIPVRVAYGADLQLVKDTLVEVAQKHPLAFDEPSPQALLLDFGDDAIKFELRCFVDFGTGLQVRDELHMQIDKAFRERGIEFPLPQLNLHLPTRRGERVISRETPESPDEPE